MSKISTVGVIGAGQMGNGIAHVCALGGYNVLLSDANPAQIDAAIQTITKNLSRQVQRDVIAQSDMDAALKRIKGAPKMGDMGACDLVIESIVEQDEAKRKVFSDLKAVLRPDAILASNTSSISITRLAAATDRADKFIGLHFANPAPVMEVVEIIRGLGTSQETYDTSVAFIKASARTSPTPEDFPAFIVNRVLVPMINEAVYTLYEGVGSVEAIDKAMRMGAHHPMGPLELADFIGLDTCLSIMQVLYEGLADSKYRPCPLLVKYVEAGWLGRKTQRGFYDYRTDPPTPTR
ncbi:MAG: 3-hydroxybutyryl-CoA dehydrogenase [Hyphomonadaceae bacterium]